MKLEHDFRKVFFVLVNIKQTCSSEMFLSFLLLAVPHRHRTSEYFKIIAVIHIQITAIFKLKFHFKNKIRLKI